MQLPVIVPFEPISAKDIPSGDGWLSQVKWDGVRILTYYDGTEVKLINRKGNERTLQYPEFRDIHSYCKAKSVILDGEMIVLEQGKPSFHGIMKRDSLRKDIQIASAVRSIHPVYMVFDLVYLNGEWMNDLPLMTRQEKLKDILMPSERVQLVPSVSSEQSLPLLNIMKEKEWEGIVCKEINSTYACGGKDGRWRKIKLGFDLYAAIGGLSMKDGRYNAVLLGLFNEQGQFIYIGHVGPGMLNQSEWSALVKQLQTHKASKMPFINKPDRTKEALWVEPLVSVKVNYMQWTPHYTLRHPVLQGIAHKPAYECVTSQ